jgi:hypothetical protein
MPNASKHVTARVPVHPWHGVCRVICSTWRATILLAQALLLLASFNALSIKFRGGRNRVKVVKKRDDEACAFILSELVFRRYQHTLELIQPEEEGAYVGVHSALANAVVASFLTKGIFSESLPHCRFRREVADSQVLPPSLCLSLSPQYCCLPSPIHTDEILIPCSLV